MFSKYKYAFIGLIAVALISVAVLAGNWFLKDDFTKNLDQELLVLAKVAANQPFLDLIKKDISDLDKTTKDIERAAIYADIGVNLYGLHSYDYAAKYFAKSLSLNADNYIGYLNLGNAQRQLRNFAGAKEAYLKSYEVSQYQDSTGCVEVGDMIQFDKLGFPASDAEKIYLDCLSKSPNDRNMVASLANYYLAHNDKKNAIKYYDQLSRIEPGNTGIFDILRELSD